MNSENKPKIWQTALLLCVAMLGLLFVGGYAEAHFGMYGSLVTECLMLTLAILFVVVTKGSLNDAFKFKKPKLREVWGSLLVYFGVYIIILAVTLLISYLMPEASYSVSYSLYSFFTDNIPPLAMFFILSVPPAFCEEMLFRGAVVYGLRGLKKYIVVLAVGIVFGIFHTNIIRFFPTAILGIAFTYLYITSENLFYPMLLHFINNAFSALSVIFSDNSAYETAAASVGSVPLMSVGVYLIFCAVSPFLIKAGISKFKPKKDLRYYCIPQMGEKDFRELENKRKANLAAMVCAAVFALSGIGVIAADQYTRNDILDVNSTVYVDYDDKQVAEFAFDAPKDDIFYFEYDIKAERGLAEVVITSADSDIVLSFPVSEESGNIPIILDSGSYTLTLYSHVGDLWEYCEQNELPYTKEGDLIKLNMAGNPDEKSEIHYAFCIK